MSVKNKRKLLKVIPTYGKKKGSRMDAIIQGARVIRRRRARTGRKKGGLLPCRCCVWDLFKEPPGWMNIDLYWAERESRREGHRRKRGGKRKRLRSSTRYGLSILL